jgi:hypothetical protein
VQFADQNTFVILMASGHVAFQGSGVTSIASSSASDKLDTLSVGVLLLSTVNTIQDCHRQMQRCGRQHCHHPGTVASGNAAGSLSAHLQLLVQQTDLKVML